MLPAAPGTPPRMAMVGLFGILWSLARIRELRIMEEMCGLGGMVRECPGMSSSVCATKPYISARTEIKEKE